MIRIGFNLANNLATITSSMNNNRIDIFYSSRKNNVNTTNINIYNNNTSTNNIVRNDRSKYIIPHSISMLMNPSSENSLQPLK